MKNSLRFVLLAGIALVGCGGDGVSDSKKLAAYRVVPGYRRLVHYIESSPEDQLLGLVSSR